MKNIIAIIFGVTISFILLALFPVFVMTFNIEPYASFGKGVLNNKVDISSLQSNILNIIYFFVFPIISLITGFIVGYIAKSKGYILGLLSMIPIVILFFDSSVTWLFGVIVIGVFSLLGVVLSKKLKNIRAKLNS